MIDQLVHVLVAPPAIEILRELGYLTQPTDSVTVGQAIADLMLAAKAANLRSSPPPPPPEATPQPVKAPPKRKPQPPPPLDLSKYLTAQRVHERQQSFLSKLQTTQDEARD